jgi:hypothetical protein
MDDVAGGGHGLIDVFRTDGSLVSRFASGGALNSPWGLALAPNDFGPFSGDLLVGNSGDGRINAYDLQSGSFHGTLTDSSGTALSIPHLWGLSFGNGHVAGATDALFFTAGVNNEQDGLFGAIQFPQWGRVGSTAGDGIFNPTAPGEAGEYPLPPDNGPTLQGNLSGTERPTVLLLPLSESALVLVPTLSAGSQHGTNSEALGPGSQTGTTSASGGVAARAFSGFAAAGVFPNTTDYRGAGVASSEAVSLNSFLDLNPLRNSSGEKGTESLRQIADGQPLVRASRAPNPSSYLLASSDQAHTGKLSRTSTVEETALSDMDVSAATALADARMAPDAALPGPETARLESPDDRTWLNWLRKLALPLSIALVWNAAYRFLAKTRESEVQHPLRPRSW